MSLSINKVPIFSSFWIVENFRLLFIQRSRVNCDPSRRVKTEKWHQAEATLVVRSGIKVKPHLFRRNWDHSSDYNRGTGTVKFLTYLILFHNYYRCHRPATISAWNSAVLPKGRKRWGNTFPACWQEGARYTEALRSAQEPTLQTSAISLHELNNFPHVNTRERETRKKSTL